MKRLLTLSVCGLVTWWHGWAAAADWAVVESESWIGFVATYEDVPFEARFESFEARIRFAPGKLDQASFDVRIDVSSVDSNSADRDEGMKQSEWFAVDRHPRARFQAQRFEAISDESFRAIGQLSLKGVTKTVELPFTWQQTGATEAVLTTETRLQRGDFNIGTGEWSEDDTIGFGVIVKARLTLVER